MKFVNFSRSPHHFEKIHSAKLLLKPLLSPAGLLMGNMVAINAADFLSIAFGCYVLPSNRQLRTTGRQDHCEEREGKLRWSFQGDAENKVCQTLVTTGPRQPVAHEGEPQMSFFTSLVLSATEAILYGIVLTVELCFLRQKAVKTHFLISCLCPVTRCFTWKQNHI